MNAINLVTVGLRGGDSSEAKAAICVDLNPGDVRPIEWAALVRRDRVEELVEQTGAELMDGPTPWDGAKFGDGTGGTVKLVGGAVVGNGFHATALEPRIS